MMMLSMQPEAAEGDATEMVTDAEVKAILASGNRLLQQAEEQQGENLPNPPDGSMSPLINAGEATHMPLELQETHGYGSATPAPPPPGPPPRDPQS